MISDNTIQLFSDYNENNIHFKYKEIEVSSQLNPSYLNRDEYKRISQIYEDNNKFELVEDDYTREIIIHIKIDEYLVLTDNYEDDFDDDEESEVEASDDDYDDEDDIESHSDKLKRHFSGMYLTDKQIKGYDKANSRAPIIRAIMDIEDNDIYSFVSIWGLNILNDYIKFWAPVRSKSEYEWIFWAITIIDKILYYFKEDEDEDYIDNDEE